MVCTCLVVRKVIIVCVAVRLTVSVDIAGRSARTNRYIVKIHRTARMCHNSTAVAIAVAALAFALVRFADGIRRLIGVKFAILTRRRDFHALVRQGGKRTPCTQVFPFRQKRTAVCMCCIHHDFACVDFRNSLFYLVANLIEHAVAD